MYEEEETAAKKLAEQKQQAWSDSASAFMNFTNFLFTVSGSSNKKLFTLNKIAGIASATIDTYIAANKTMASLPYPANIAATASVVAQGLANVASISSQKFGGGGAASAGGAGAGTYTSPIITRDSEQTNVTPIDSKSININIYGNVVDHDKFARELVPSITKAIGDGSQLEFA